MMMAGSNDGHGGGGGGGIRDGGRDEWFVAPIV